MCVCMLGKRPLVCFHLNYKAKTYHLSLPLLLLWQTRENDSSDGGDVDGHNESPLELGVRVCRFPFYNNFLLQLQLLLLLLLLLCSLVFCCCNYFLLNRYKTKVRGTWKRATTQVVVLVVVSQLFLKYGAHIFLTFLRHIWIAFALEYFAQTTTNRKKKMSKKKQSWCWVVLSRFVALHFSTFFIWFLPFVYCAKAPVVVQPFFIIFSSLFFFALTLFAGLLYINVFVRAPGWQLCCVRCEARRGDNSRSAVCACSWCWGARERMRAKATQWGEWRQQHRARMWGR